MKGEVIEMKIITFVKREIGSDYIRTEHDILHGHSAQETFEYWSNILHIALNQGIIVDYQVELV